MITECQGRPCRTSPRRSSQAGSWAQSHRPQRPQQRTGMDGPSTHAAVCSSPPPGTWDSSRGWVLPAAEISLQVRAPRRVLLSTESSFTRGRSAAEPSVSSSLGPSPPFPASPPFPSESILWLESPFTPISLSTESSLLPRLPLNRVLLRAGPSSRRGLPSRRGPYTLSDAPLVLEASELSVP